MDASRHSSGSSAGGALLEWALNASHRATDTPAARSPFLRAIGFGIGDYDYSEHYPTIKWATREARSRLEPLSYTYSTQDRRGRVLLRRPEA